MNPYRRFGRFFVGCVCAFLLLSAFGGTGTPDPCETAGIRQHLQEDVPPEEEDGQPERTDRQALMEMMIDPPYDFDPSGMLPSDFGDFFTEAFPVSLCTEALLPDTEYETTMTVVKGQLPGPSVFVVAGIHGDETAGWSTGDLLTRATIRAGELWIISPANAHVR